MNDETVSANELIHALEQAGRTPDLDLIRACLNRIDELESGLLNLLRTDPWQKYELKDDTNPGAYGDVHAGHLLIATRSQAALPIFDEIFHDPKREHLIEWFGMKMHHYGSMALPFFANLMLDEEAFGYGRITAAAIISHIAYNEPDYKPIIISTLQKLLPPLPEGDEPFMGDQESDEMWTWATLELSHLGDKESQAQIEALYAVDAIETGIIGDYDDYVRHLQNKRTDLPEPYDIIETYESLHRQATREAQQAAQLAAQQQQQQSLIKDRAAEREVREHQSAERAAAKAAARGERPSHTHEQAAAGEPSTRKVPKVSRNALCPCGSGKKYKKCHGRLGG